MPITADDIPDHDESPFLTILTASGARYEINVNQCQARRVGPAFLPPNVPQPDEWGSYLALQISLGGPLTILWENQQRTDCARVIGIFEGLAS